MTEPQRIARDIKRLWNLHHGKPLEKRETVEVIRWAEKNVAETLGKLSSDPETAVQKLRLLTRELQRPYRSDSQKQFARAHDALCRENNGKLPSYGAVHRKLEQMLPRNCVPSIRTLRRINGQILHLPMSGKIGRPKKV